MSSPMSIKRRKLNDATSKLTKPFVSPMRTPKTERTPLKDDASKANIGPPAYIPSIAAHTIKPAYPTLSQSVSKPARSTFTPVKSTPARKPTSFPTLSSSRKASPEEQAAQKAISTLERQIRKVQNELDTLEQAHKLSTSTTDDELRELAEKWRLCSQSVAEELFGTVKERVCRMGGVQAWREMEQKKYERANGLGEFAPQEEQEDDDADCEFDSEGEELPEAEQEWRKKQKRQAIQEMKDAQDVPDEPPEVDPRAQQQGQVWAEQGKDDDTFTMDMMLRSLNIDLKVIGYDKETQRWI